MTYKLVAFDLDGTLAESKSPISDEMVETLDRLLEIVPVCVITGGDESQLREQVASRLKNTKQLHLMPTCGTKYLINDKDNWSLQYSENIPTIDTRRIIRAIVSTVMSLGMVEHEIYGNTTECRGSQVTFSALGQNAPLDRKLAWDPDGSKKKKLREALSQLLPDFEVRSGGTTSIDITRKGIDKAYGIRKLAEITGILPSEMIFIGDRLDFDGNDHPVIYTGAVCIEITSPEETLSVVNNLIENVLKEN